MKQNNQLFAQFLYLNMMIATAELYLFQEFKEVIHNHINIYLYIECFNKKKTSNFKPDVTKLGKQLGAGLTGLTDIFNLNEQMD